MKKTASSVLALGVLFATANAGLCTKSTINTVNAFGAQMPKTTTQLSSMLETGVTVDMAIQAIAEIGNTAQFNYSGLSPTGQNEECTLIGPNIIKVRIGKFSDAGRVGTIKVNTGEKMGQNGNLKTSSSIDPQYLAVRIYSYLSACDFVAPGNFLENRREVQRRNALLRTYIAQTSGPYNALVFDYCGDDQIIDGDGGWGAADVAVNMAIQMLQNPSRVTNDFVSLFISKSGDELTAAMMSNPSVKAMFERVQDVMNRPAAVTQMLKDKKEFDANTTAWMSRVAEQRSSTPLDYNTCDKKNIIGEISNLASVGRLNGVNMVIFAKKERGLFSDTITAVGATQATNCYTAKEVNERKRVSDYNSALVSDWDAMHPLWTTGDAIDLDAINAKMKDGSGCKASAIGCAFNSMFHAVGSIKSGIDTAADTALAPLNWAAEAASPKRKVK